MDLPVITEHASAQFRERAQLLGLNHRPGELTRLLSSSVRELPRIKTIKLNHLKREIVHGKTIYLISSGWRFVVAGGYLITVERIKPHENYLKDRMPGGSKYPIPEITRVAA